MKKSLISATLLLMMFIMNISWSESRLKIGEKAYVWARNGIWLLKEPTINAKQIEKLSYGTPLKILNEGKGVYGSVAVYGERGSTTYSVTGAWRKVHDINNGKEGYVFDGWLLTLPPAKCKTKAESEQSCESIIDWGTRNFRLINKVHEPLAEGCESCGITRYTFGKGFFYVDNEPDYGSDEELNVPGLSLSEGVVVALGLFGWWDYEKPRIEISETYIAFLGTYQTLIIELTKTGVKISDSCRDC